MNQKDISVIYELIRVPFPEFRDLVKRALNQNDTYFYAIKDKRFRRKGIWGIKTPTIVEIQSIRNIAAICVMNLVNAIHASCNYRFPIKNQIFTSSCLEITPSDFNMTGVVYKSFKGLRDRVQSEVARSCGIKPQNFYKSIVGGEVVLSEVQLLNAEKALIKIIVSTVDLFISRFQIPLQSNKT